MLVRSGERPFPAPCPHYATAMTFNPGSQLDSSQVSRRSGGRGVGTPIKVGGGIGSLAVPLIGV